MVKPTFTPPGSGGINVVLLVVHANIVIYALCYWLTQPVLPFLMKEHGATSLSFGIFQSLFNVVQLLGGLFVGDLQDRYSGSTALNITQLGSAAVYLTMFLAWDLNMLYWSRLPTVLQQSMQVAQACVSKASDGDERTVSLGRLSLSYAAGMIIGSLASGRIAEMFGNKIPAVIAFIICLTICVVNRFMLAELDTVKSPNTASPASNTSKQNSPDDDDPTGKKAKKGSKGKAEYLGLKGYVKLIAKLWKVVLFLGLMFSTKSLYEPVYSLTLLEQYDVKQAQMGTLMSGFAGLGVLSNVVILPAIMKLTSERKITTGSLVGGALCYGALTVFHSELDIVGYLGVFAALSVCSSMLYTLSTSYISRVVDKSAHGQAIALSHSLRSAVGIVCPLIGTYLLQQQGGYAVSGLGAGLLMLSAMLS